MEQHAHHHSHNGNGTLHAVSVALLLAFGLGGCASHPTPETTHIEVMVDKTDTTHAQDIEPMLDYVFSFADLDTVHGHWGKVTVVLSPIGETSSQHTEVVELAASESYWGRHEQAHRKHPAQFREKLRQALQRLTHPGNGMLHSHIHRNFFYRLDALAHEKGRRIVLSWSDLILNSPEVSLYHYREQPELLWEHRDSLLALMTKHYDLPDASGIQLVNVHQPSKLNDELHEACKHLFGHYLEGAGIEVEFRTSIPTHHPALTMTELTGQ